MVRRLSAPAVRTGGCLRSRPSRITAAWEAGSQTLEMALLAPLVVAVMAGLISVALVGADLVGVQVLAREGARAAARGQDAAEPVRAAAGGRQVEVRVVPAQGPPGSPVTVTVRLRSRVSDHLGLQVWLPGHATMLREPAA